MNDKIIRTSRKTERRPGLAAVLSLAAPGLGQIYSGSPTRGAAFLLLCIVPLWALPFYVLLTGKQAIGTLFIVSCAAVCAAGIASCLHAFLATKKKPEIRAARYNSVPFYVLYAPVAWAAMAGSLFTFFSFFPLSQAGPADSGPSLPRGQIILVNRLADKKFSPGDLVMTLDGGVFRVIALSRDRAALRQGMPVINGEPLKHRVPSDAETAGLSPGSTENLYWEKNRDREYAVEQELPKKITEAAAGVPLKQNELFLARDNRMKQGWYKAVSRDGIAGTVEPLVPVLWRIPWLSQ